MNLLSWKYLILSAVFLVTTRIELHSQKLGKTLLFDYVTDGVVDSSWKNLTDTCQLTFPKRLFYKGIMLQDLLSAGDLVNVSFGYDNNLHLEFTGYLVRFNARIPLTLYFEDTMWLFKRDSLTKSFGVNANLRDVISFLVSHYNTKYSAGITAVSESASLGSFSIKDISGVRVLQKLKETYGLISYFRGNTLYCGFAYQVESKPAKTVRFEFQKNIISDNLEYRTAEDIKIRVKAISFDVKNKKTVAYGGDPDGELHTMHLPIGLSRDAVEKHAEAEAKRIRFTGYQGQFTGFHRPVVEHGDIVELKDPEYPEREGRFLVDRVVTSFGVGGIRRNIEPGKKA